jgi:predicted nucleic acid-binding protein
VNALAIIDTDILIDAARRTQAAIEYLSQLERRSGLAVSVVTQMELLVGCRSRVELQNTERFLQHFQVLKVNEPICDCALQLLLNYRLSHGLLIPDALIAATAMTLELPLVSKNQRDYRYIDGLQLLQYQGESRSEAKRSPEES